MLTLERGAGKSPSVPSPIPLDVAPGASFSIMEYLDEILAGVAIFLAVSTPLSAGLLAAARRFEKYARTTPGTRDDEIGAGLVTAAEAFSKGLGFIGRILPVVTRGGKVERKL